jgi:hypothetical protein
MPSCVRAEREMGSTLLRDAQQVPESSVATATVSSFSLREYEPFHKKARTKDYLAPSTWYVRVELMSWAFSVAYHFLCLSLEFNSFLNRKCTLEALSFRGSAAWPEPPTPSSSCEAVRVEVSRGPNSDPP